METEISYTHNNTHFKGILCTPLKKPKGCVLIAHAWGGRDQFAIDKAQKMAALGYLGFALDMYGDAKLGQTNDEKNALMTPLVEDRKVLQSRVHAAVEAVKLIPEAKSLSIAAIGYCFGGMGVLDLARMGADVKGVVAVHGILEAPSNILDKPSSSKVLALHGYDDPLATPKDLINFANEMNERSISWQLHAFGQTGHSFTNPQAHDLAGGNFFNKEASDHSEKLIINFMDHIFA